MEYQVKLRNVLRVLCLSAAVCLTGCGISFGGYLPGGREELVFVCGEELPPEESGAGSGPEETSAPEPAGSLETEVSEESTVLGMEGRSGAAASDPAGDTAAPDNVSGGGEAPGVAADGRVDINTAGVEELMTLKGIGETRAKAIIEYRTQNGPFTKAEDIMQITGIKEGIYTKIQDQIIVR